MPQSFDFTARKQFGFRDLIEQILLFSKKGKNKRINICILGYKVMHLN